MELILGVPLFFFVTWITTIICVRKGHSLRTGIILGVILQPVGRLLAMAASPLMGAMGVEAFAITFVFSPLLGCIFPLVVASLLPIDTTGNPQESDEIPKLVPCRQCGRENAVSSRICPRCGNRSE
jgi:hypothetical protein